MSEVSKATVEHVKENNMLRGRDQRPQGGWTVGDPKTDFQDVDPLVDAERKVLSMKSKKLIKEKKASIKYIGEPSARKL